MKEHEFEQSETDFPIEASPEPDLLLASWEPEKEFAPDPPVPAPIPASGVDCCFALIALALGYALVYAFSSGRFALKLTIFTALYIGFVLSYLFFSGKKPARESWFWLALLLCIVIPYTFWSLMPLLQFLALTAVTAYWTVCAAKGLTLSDTSNWFFVDFANSLFILPFSNLACQWSVLCRRLRENSTGKKLMPLFLGVALSLPFLAIVLPLLSRADAQFASLMNWIFRTLSEHTSVYLLRFLFSLPVSCALFGLVYGSIHKRHMASPDPERLHALSGELQRLPVSALCMALGLVCVFYLIFIGIQGGYFFSAFVGIRPERFTYAEYARKGFFELCEIAVLNLLLLLFAHFFSRKSTGTNHPLRFFKDLLSLLTLLLIATAASKMLLYISAYGLTELRILATTFLLWLAIVFLALLLWQHRKLQLMRISVFSGGVLFAQLCLLPWDNIIFYFNQRM